MPLFTTLPFGQKNPIAPSGAALHWARLTLLKQSQVRGRLVCDGTMKKKRKKAMFGSWAHGVLCMMQKKENEETEW